MVDNEMMKMKGGQWKCQIQIRVALQVTIHLKVHNRIYFTHSKYFNKRKDHKSMSLCQYQ